MVIGAALAIALYAWPLLSRSEAHVRVTSSSTADDLNLRLMHQVEVSLVHAGIEARRVVLDQSGVTVSLSDTDSRDRAMNALRLALGSTCAVTPEAAPLVP
jgi:hypothetical protein